MDDIKEFLGISDDKNLYKENKTATILVFFFTLIFTGIPSFAQYFSTYSTIPFVFFGLFILLSLGQFAFIVFTKKKEITYETYFAFQCYSWLMMGLIILYSTILMLVSQNIGFSFFHVIGILLGILFSTLLIVIRIKKWKNLNNKDANKKRLNKPLFGIMGILGMCLASVLKNTLGNNSVIGFATGLMFILVFLFLSLSLFMLMNYILVKKHIK